MSIYHIWSVYVPKEPEALRRQALAHDTWRLQKWMDLGIQDSQLPRLFEEGTKRLPFLRDVFDAGCAEHEDEDILVYSNADIGFCTHATIAIALMLQFNDAGYTNRRDAAHRVDSIPSDEQIKGWADYCGTDTFFFRVRWWKTWRTDMPDMMLAREAWDPCLRILMEKSNANKPLSIGDITWHERHGGDGYWESADLRYSLGGQLHNLRAAYRYMMLNGKNPATYGVKRV